MDAIDWANIYARCVFGAYARLCNYVCHECLFVLLVVKSLKVIVFYYCIVSAICKGFYPKEETTPN